MADKTAARRARASHTAIDVQALRASVRSRLKGRSVTSAGAIQQHADAVGRGERSISPAKAKASRTA